MIGTVLSGILIDTVTSTAVDVVTKRTLDPRIKLAGHAWRAFSLVDKAFDVHGAYRIAAYSDAVNIIASEIVVQKTSGAIASSIPKLDGINFAVHVEAEGLLLKPDFTVQFAHEPQKLTAVHMLYDDRFIKREFESHGGALAEMTIPCTERGSDAFKTVEGILRYPEAKRQRRHRDWYDNTPWLSRINTGLGYALWRPVPDIGLGARSLSNVTSYNGIFRRETAEGYGRITWTNGDAYFGQVRDGWERGYGMKQFSDGTILVGYFNDMSLSLGVSVSPNRDRAFYGAHDRGKLTGYGRQIGLRNGVGSASGFWQNGERSGKDISLHADVLAKNARRFSKVEGLEDMAREYQHKADEANADRDRFDGKVLKAVSEFI